jgi:hypothetical protein
MDVLPFAVVALIDALGFKRIAERMTPEAAIAAMKAAHATLDEMTAWMNNDGGYLHYHSLGGLPIVRRWWFSDTIVLVVQPPRELIGCELDEQRQAALLDVATVCVGYFLRAAADAALPFSFRGVITVGDLVIDDDEKIFMGSAMNDAAAKYEEALGAFVWLTQTASKLPMSTVSRNHHGLVRHGVPLHKGRSITTDVVSPFIDTLVSSTSGKQIRENILNTMASEHDDVATKRRNTLAFFDRALELDFRPSRLFVSEG